MAMHLGFRHEVSELDLFYECEYFCKVLPPIDSCFLLLQRKAKDTDELKLSNRRLCNKIIELSNLLKEKVRPLMICQHFNLKR